MITLETASKYLKLTTTLSEKNFTPFIGDALERYLRPFLGDDLIKLLWDSFNGDSTEEDKARLDELMLKVEAPLSRFTFLVAAPSLDINVGQSGFTTAGGGNMVPASEARVKRFTESIEQLGWDGVETVLRFLEQNKTDYPEWVDSDAYKSFTRGFIRSAEKFNAYVDIDGSRLRFFRLRQAMDLIEALQVEPLLGLELLTTLKLEDLEGNVYAENANRAKAIDLTCKFIALQTAADKIDETYRLPASHVYNMLRDHLNANPTDFTELFPDEDSETKRAPYPSYVNTVESPIFNFGG
jgi:hypothetical protein